jgi:hypothetical protein
LESACRLSRVWALATVFSARLAAFAAFFDSFEDLAAAVWTASMNLSSSRWAYQMAIVPMAAKPAIASR